MRTINRSFSFSKRATELLEFHKIENASKFISDLVERELNDEAYRKKQLIRQFNQLRAEFEKEFNQTIEFDITPLQTTMAVQ